MGELTGSVVDEMTAASNPFQPLHVWLVEISDSLPRVDRGQRPYRAGMLTDALLSEGHEVVWWSSTFNHQQKRQRYMESTTVTPSPQLTIRMIYGPGYARNRSFARLYHNKAVAGAFGVEAHSALIYRRPDIIIAHFPTLEVTSAAVEFARVNGVPVLVDIRDQYPDSVLSTFPWWLRALLRPGFADVFRKVRRLCARATGITAVSHSNLAWALANASRLVTDADRCFPLGFPREIGDCKYDKDLVDRVSSRADKFTIIFAGSFVRAYDLDTVLAAARQLLAAGRHDIRFILVGDGDRMASVRERVRALPNVVLTGWCDRPTLARILDLADVGLGPYAKVALITLPNKPFEYMAAGLPLLNSLEGELAKLVATERIGLQYCANDPAHLRSQIEWLKSNPVVTKEMGERARRLFETRFTAESIYRGFVRHIEKVVLRNLYLRSNVLGNREPARQQEF